jgi:ketosteroid isomerase-like protein
MKRGGIFIISILFIFLFLFGCAAQTKLKDYKPKSAQEEEVLNVLTKMTEAWKKKDVEAYLAFFHDNAKIRTRQRPIHEDGSFISKQQYPSLSFEWNQFSGDELVMTNPKMTILEDKATLKVTDVADGMNSRWTYEMEKEKSEWYVIRFDYTPYH